ncbi:NAD-dependent epimerase/dehydratase family protein [Cohnella mopanensis]|uniref:NAD-dependent epimerase/dehydratase family protein n=1 Tax=Cohnella mopanensis TaxID=2911966 RepID=UPI001EF7A690|nr:NAD-dependent epimerase/dehydratase family protein [Cohnella mopanensis]
MNVIITGGYGFIGSFVAERFYKEGHQIYIIDNLSSGQKSNVSIPHKFYHMSAHDLNCEQVFQSISPDVVVHLAAQVDVVTSVKKPHADTQSNILGLVNILRCAHKTKAKKFIFASSAAVYGPYDEVSLKEDLLCSPVSPYGINKYLGEYYCAKWMELYGLQTLCFRFSNVYGPRQGSKGEGGVVSIFMERIRDGKELNVYGDGRQTRDFIYVEDIVDGIYRGANSEEVTGVYNLSTNTETSVNQLIEIIGNLQEPGKVIYHDSRPGDIYRSSLDNTRVKRDLDWVPIYTIQNGLTKTYEWFMESIAQKQGKKEEAKERKEKGAINWWPRLRPYFENLAVFAIVALLSLYGPAVLKYEDMEDFKIIYIILLGIFYGTKQSVLAAVLSTGLYFYSSLGNGREWISLLYDPEALFVIAMYMFVSLIVGFVSDKSRRDYSQVSNELLAVNEKYVFLKKINADNQKVKEELQRRLINSKDSIGRIHGIIKALESMEPEEIVISSVSVLSNLMETDKISVYSVNDSDFLRMMIKSNAVNFNLPKTIRLSEYPHFQEVVSSGKLFVNKAMDLSLPMLAAPICHEGKVVALVSLHEPSFDKLNMHYENLFKVTIDMIAGSLSRAFRYVGATRNERYVDETRVLSPAFFEQVLQIRISAKQQYNTDFVLLDIDSSNQSVTMLANQISGNLRESDSLGIIKERLVLLLSNSNTVEADSVIQRLNKRGIMATIIDEDQVYA